MSEAVNISTPSTVDYSYHHDHHQQHQQDDDANDVNDEPFYELVKQPIHLVVIYSLAYAAVFLLALIGNVLVFWSLSLSDTEDFS